MKVPFSWLKEFVDIDVTAQELEEKLFSCGFEVEELIPLDAGISKVVVGKIVEMEKQEGTHLTKCVVDCGDYGHDIRISTGAANMKLGDCVPAALDGSTLPGGIKISTRCVICAADWPPAMARDTNDRFSSTSPPSCSRSTPSC